MEYRTRQNAAPVLQKKHKIRIGQKKTPLCRNDLYKVSWRIPVSKNMDRVSTLPSIVKRVIMKLVRICVSRDAFTVRKHFGHTVQQQP